ncbi:PAP2-domain-containing protein [Auriscalpium vulgare]|uniref:PAP2-domain-containing protein n=1 Tax=Auriscalpium vulgare TaxID=40419 RepID=A0ACB8RQM3_9AGAM|nr:PAP2-domain-containing protein [Auriscalpium vulgare]
MAQCGYYTTEATRRFRDPNPDPTRSRPAANLHCATTTMAATMSPRTSIVRTLRVVFAAFLAAVGRLDKSLNPRDSLVRLQKHSFTPSDSIYLFHALNAAFWLSVMKAPALLKLGIPVAHITVLLIPFTSQFFLPALPVTSWVMCYFSSQFIPHKHRPGISVSVLPTLESVLYGANISDLLTRYTHPVLDIMAWLPYGLMHFILPFVVAIFLWLFRQKEVLHLWARAFGYMNFIGVAVQILFPCSSPWYEVIFGLTPANYSMKGSPGGLLRIDNIFHSHGYTITFSNSPVIFGAFPSLHSGCATMEALFISHFFPQTTKYAWGYASVLWWATMYLTHHYLIDVVGGSCLAIAFFYFFLPDDLRGSLATAGPNNALQNGSSRTRSKYALYDIETPRPRGARPDDEYELSSDISSHASDDDEVGANIAYRSPAPNTPTSAMPLIGPNFKHAKGQPIASLIRADDRVEEGWSPIGNGSFREAGGR